MTEQKSVRNKHASSTSQPCLYTLHIELRPNEIRPPVWRRLEVDGRISLAKLHHFIQAAFGWSDSHLHQFKIHDKVYAMPDPGDEDALLDERKAYLNRLLATNDTMLYRYDLGDNWEHLITVEAIRSDLDNDPKGGAWVLDGERACPPEDVGGVEGYADFLEVLQEEPDSEEAARLREWADGDFDPERFDRRLANAAIMRLLFNRWGGK
ncbi:plasmid pRiA4b ORF-3 family protein [Methylomonas sp. MO1]|uniref:plasmid pRiA4b ORF-3 family protein n=1 Tax=unclassified Methylomonas TaxID=2608980 RepID=UPI000479283D|nr:MULTISPECIES: plasmid pRiA4b ORF-3 family protein [unclassified Methylomonas]MDT4290553.1 plasmid pRiA4b ORF-3 family protein [Methylomonas sp. MO1]